MKKPYSPSEKNMVLQNSNVFAVNIHFTLCPTDLMLDFDTLNTGSTCSCSYS